MNGIKEKVIIKVRFMSVYGSEDTVTCDNVHAAILVWNALKHAGHTMLDECPQ
jgi:hypothetical protein